MSRRREVPKREILPDPKYGDLQLAKFINTLMLHGKKAVAEKIIYGAIDELTKNKKSKEGLEVLNDALNNVKPQVEVKSRRVGGATYQVPVEVKSTRQLTLAMRWIIECARKRNEKSMTKKLAAELLDASENKGLAIKKREDTIKMAEANKAFSHFRW
ncbi:MAG: 30S ribosomal protein S7 [Gammaproteobacteria bacterium]|nr:30S ribosomal protein S7 [Gammaproteobacteria bacterium]|tara:strand:- start:4504 stop:4977 length:474 start_codon:yes stop_codon:yes gene_type:complete